MADGDDPLYERIAILAVPCRMGRSTGSATSATAISAKAGATRRCVRPPNGKATRKRLILDYRLKRRRTAQRRRQDSGMPVPHNGGAGAPKRRLRIRRDVPQSTRNPYSPTRWPCSSTAFGLGALKPSPEPLQDLDRAEVDRPARASVVPRGSDPSGLATP